MPDTFSALDHFNPAGRTAWYTLPIPGAPRIKCRFAGTSNRAFTTAYSKASIKHAKERQGSDSEQELAAIYQLELTAERQAMPGNVIEGWEGWERVPGMPDEPVPFTIEACRDLCDRLAEHLMRGLSNWCSVPGNFPAENGRAPAPTHAQVAVQAGN